MGSTAIRLGALTSVDVLRLDEAGTQLRLAQGTLQVRLRHLEITENFEINTPGGAVLLTLPGTYRVSVDPSGTVTTVLVRQGQADVLTGAAPISVRDNQFINLAGGNAEFAAPPPAEEFESWAYARDRQDERVVATRYVPPAMTGYEDLDQHGSWQNVAQYGTVWFPTAVAADWAPYRHGRWVWIAPWGWTWIDSAPWGFAPYHYGRWVWIGGRWAWAPGARVVRPVYAPALVAFIGGANWSVSLSAGPAVAWVPLGWREPYIPWYAHSPAYVRDVNITHVTNVTVINQYTNISNVQHVNRGVHNATTVVTRDTFVSGGHAHEAPLAVPAQALADARVARDAPVTRPDRVSLMATRASAPVPATVAAREVVALRAPAPPAHLQTPADNPVRRDASANDAPARVRVLGNAPFTAPRRTPETANAPAVAPNSTTTTTTPSAAPPVAPMVKAPATPPASIDIPRNTARPPEPTPRTQARQLEQQKIQEQKERQRDIAVQRAQEVQQQRERQF
jgi:hypothetical protein